MGVTMRGHCNVICCILLLIGVGALVALSVATESGSSATGTVSEAEAPKSNKIFNFDQYKRTFGKHYKSFLEELSRRRLFLSSALRAFLSKIKFKYKLSPYYLAVNNLSDRSPEERDRMRNKYAGLDESEYETPTNDSSTQDETIANENKHVEREGAKELEGIGAREHSDSELGYKELSEALADKQPGQSRKKRDTESSSARGLKEKLIKSQQVCGLNVQQEELTWLWLKSKKEKDSSGPISKDRVSGAIATEKLPDKVFFDHRDSGCLLPPRHQGDCGCCYAFASIAMMEWLYCKKKGELLAFSEQYMIDCGNKRYGKLMNGCEGSADSAVPMFHHNFGLELAKHYCYRGKNGKCMYEENFDLKKTGYIRMELGSVFKLHRDRFDDYIEHSPIYVAVVSDEEFDAYGGGVDNGARCDHDADHAMLLIGHGRENNTEYWLLRNSYGTDWGIGGYYKLAKSAAGQCMENKGYIFGSKNGKDFDHVRPRKTNRVRRNRNHVRLEKPRPIK